MLKNTCLILAYHRNVKKLFKHIITFFSDLARIQIHNHAYNLVGIYFEKAEYKHNWHKLYFTQQQRTGINVLVFKCCILNKIILRYNKKILQVVQFPDLSLSGMSVDFTPYRKDKSGQTGKKSGRLLTLIKTSI
jgi:hypothetical protein